MKIYEVLGDWSIVWSIGSSFPRVDDRTCQQLNASAKLMWTPWLWYSPSIHSWLPCWWHYTLYIRVSMIAIYEIHMKSIWNPYICHDLRPLNNRTNFSRVSQGRSRVLLEQHRPLAVGHPLNLHGLQCRSIVEFARLRGCRGAELTAHGDHGQPRTATKVAKWFTCRSWCSSNLPWTLGFWTFQLPTVQLW